MKSYCTWHAFTNLNTSPRIRCKFLIPNCLQQDIMKFCWVCAISTDVTSLAPREINSRPMPPVPANKSSMSNPSKSIRLVRRLNKLSFAKSVVGRAVIFLGGINRRPLNIPEIILISLSYRLIAYSLPIARKASYNLITPSYLRCC